ncbi:MAG: hypothetical protein EA353_13140 [Puniceicoccaceae bacterium]|nr:MAG: hypothetical protein EA353_13140 [Puniceicoccaceae bacterium]
MAISLEELRRQRAAIQQHLDWLDAKIAAEDTAADTAADSPVACPLAGRPEHELPPVACPLAGRPKHDESPENDPEPASETGNTEGARERARHETSEATPEPLADPEAPHFKAKTAKEVTRAKIGCVVIFALATALFLFLLFGLPYLL